MIKNERQYRTTRQAIEQFEHALASRSAEPPSGAEIHPQLWRAERDAIEAELEQLRASADRYETLKSGARRVHPINSWADVPHALIEARIAANLTQRELAERLGIPEQQLQRYEATDYASASLTRIREIAAALKLELAGVVIPPDVVVSSERFFDRLSDLGIDRKWLVEKLLPSGVGDAIATITRKSKGTATAALVQSADLVSRVFNVSIDALFGDHPILIAPQRVGQTRYKRPRRGQTTTRRAKSTAYTSYAYFIAQRVVRASEHVPHRQLPTSAAAWRSQLAEGGEALSFASALRFFWNHGVPVIPLADPGAFHGACWRLENGREVIVLKQRSQSTHRWLGDLLHEGAHLVQEPGDVPFAVVEETENPSVTDERERAATEFAADVMLQGRAEALVEQALRAADGNIPFLKRIVPRVAQQASVPVGSLAYYMAYYLARETNGRANWWGTAQALQPTENDPWRLTRNMLLDIVNFDALSAVDRDLVIRALSGDSRVPV